MIKICGVYKITSPSGKIYIGQSVDVHKRFGAYRKFRCNKQLKLFNSFLKHGVENHTFEIIHECEREQLNELEKHYVYLFDTFGTNRGLNLRDGGGNTGRASDESRRRMSEASKGQVSWNKGLAGTYKFSEEGRKNIANAQIGRKHKEETKIKISEALKGKLKSKEHNRKNSEAQRGRVDSEETRRKKSESHKGKLMNEETKRKIAMAWKGRKHSEESNKKNSEAHKGKKLSPESIIKREETKRRIRQERLTMIF